jgi:hypothetical protein
MSEGSWTLAQFVRTHIATSEEAEEWDRVRDAKPPEVHTRPAPPSSHIPYEREADKPSAEYARKEDLKRSLIRRLCNELSTGAWDVSARLGPEARQKLEPSDWVEGQIDFDRSLIGRFAHVEVHRVKAETNREILQRFIELVCDAAGPPGRGISLTSIRDIAMRLYPEIYTAPDWAVAAKEARIPDEWHHPGRKRGNSKSD